MTLFQIVVLAVVQGITEFLPISSAGHLILIPRFLEWPDQGLGFDLAVHVGTLAAVVIYYRADVARLIRDWIASLLARKPQGESTLAWGIIVATIPVGMVGLLVRDLVETSWRTPTLIAATTIGFGLLLLIADRRAGARGDHEMTWRDFLVIGCAQAISLVPGTSRSGITMTAGMLAGLSRQTAARFSFLLSIPVTALAGSLVVARIIVRDPTLDWTSVVLGAVLSAVTAFLCIHYFLKWLTHFGMLPYVIYRLVLGAVVLAVLVV
ncbi:MAG TPA: undecaprenyl-diphosphate phosphatase [Gammaproteobacteria bacterium]